MIRAGKTFATAAKDCSNTFSDVRSDGVVCGQRELAVDAAPSTPLRATALTGNNKLEKTISCGGLKRGLPEHDEHIEQARATRNIKYERCGQAKNDQTIETTGMDDNRHRLRTG